MRDPQRIQEILGLINDIWVKSPDLRFQQLMFALQRDYSAKNGGIGKVEQEHKDGFVKVAFDLFYVEDDKFKEYLEGVLANGF